ncbi:MAG: DUF58 domain-containing protein, partial [bacterium]
RLLVYPKAMSAREMTVLGEGTLLNVGLETTRRSGTGEEFSQLRDYEVGDPPRLIHWPKSARHNRLLVKSFEKNIQTEVTLFVDLGRLGLTGLGDVTSLEYLVKAAATVACVTLERGHQLQAVAFGGETQVTPLGGGPQHLLALLDQMVLWRADGKKSFDEGVREELHRVRAGSTVAWCLSASRANLEALKALLQLHRQDRVKTLVYLVDDRSFLSLYPEQQKILANRPAAETVARMLIEEGATVYVLSRTEKLEKSLSLPAQVEGLAEIISHRK